MRAADKMGVGERQVIVGDRSRWPLALAFFAGASVVGAALVAVAAENESAPFSLRVAGVGLPLAIAPTLGVLVGAWPAVRRRVAPAGLARGPRILSLPVLLVISPPLLIASCALGWGDWLLGLAVSVAVASGLGIYLRCQIRVRRPEMSHGEPNPRAASLLRTPGVAPVGALVTTGALILALTDTGGSTAWAWPLSPAGYTVLVTYGTVIVALAPLGNVSAGLLGLFGMGLIGWSFASVSLTPPAPPAAYLALGLVGAALIIRVERARASALSAVLGHG